MTTGTLIEKPADVVVASASATAPLVSASAEVIDQEKVKQEQDDQEVLAGIANLSVGGDGDASDQPPALLESPSKTSFLGIEVDPKVEAQTYDTLRWIPLFGDAYSLGRAAYFALQGEMEEAGTCAMAVIPFAGNPLATAKRVRDAKLARDSTDFDESKAASIPPIYNKLLSFFDDSESATPENTNANASEMQPEATPSANGSAHASKLSGSNDVLQKALKNTHEATLEKSKSEYASATLVNGVGQAPVVLGQ